MQNEMYNSTFCNMQKAPKSCISLPTSIISMPLLSLPTLYFARPVCRYYSWSEIESYMCRITWSSGEEFIAHCGRQKRTYNYGNTTQLRPGTHYPHVTWAHVIIRVRLGCERRFLTLNSMVQIHTSVTLLTSRDLTWSSGRLTWQHASQRRAVVTSHELMWCYACGWDVKGDF
jgi:hypothetical protein